MTKRTLQTVWSKAYESGLRRGWDHGYAAFSADATEKRYLKTCPTSEIIDALKDNKNPTVAEAARRLALTS